MSGDPPLALVEDALRARLAAGDVLGAVAGAIDAYGAEIHGWLAAVLRDRDAADDVFSALSADVVQDLAAFRWECSLRGWMYRLGRYRLIAWRRAPHRRPERNLPLSSPDIDAAVQRARSTTAPWLQTDVKAAVARLREGLGDDDQTLLILRVDRDLPWRDVAQVMDEPEAALRKRFERVKARLRALAREAKLVE